MFTFGDYTYSVKGINWGSSLPKKPQQPRALILGSSHILSGLRECGRCRESLFPETELSFSLSWIETHFHQASRLNKSLAVCSLKDVWVLSGPRFLQIKLLKDLCSALCVNVSLLFSWMNSRASKAGSCVGCFSFWQKLSNCFPEQSTTLHSYPQCVRDPGSPCPCWHVVVLSRFWCSGVR